MVVGKVVVHLCLVGLCSWSCENFKRDCHRTASVYKQYTSLESWDNCIHQYLILCCNLTYSKVYEEFHNVLTIENRDCSICICKSSQFLLGLSSFSS